MFSDISNLLSICYNYYVICSIRMNARLNARTYTKNMLIIFLPEELNRRSFASGFKQILHLGSLKNQPMFDISIRQY